MSAAPSIDIDMVGAVFQRRATEAEGLCLQLAAQCRSLQGDLKATEARLAEALQTIEALKLNQPQKDENNGG
ncbi:hypothetical protein [Aurantimonas sp. 22II-16-19i]|uniref:hypothetical protein n=1 Tax=Aurantimonas sp. 22II-16-19i TaxID=1317114 RepID=UPI0009F7B10D|nr:hypothetical protein [Aurantimonas sp. 22II-16-19i]ORE89731.1 hypothetical protein ATO4_23672 [Aurantimonas sp. 22II-16-19i]